MKNALKQLMKLMLTLLMMLSMVSTRTIVFAEGDDFSGTDEANEQPTIQVSNEDVKVSINILNGYDRTTEHGFIWTADTHQDNHPFQFQVKLSVDSEVANEFEAESIVLKIPKSIFRHMRENEEGLFDIDDLILDQNHAGKVTYRIGLGTTPSEEQALYYREEGDYLIITNGREIDKQDYYFTITYYTTYSTYYYRDYDTAALDKCASLTPSVEMTATDKAGDTFHLTSEEKPVFLDTDVKLADQKIVNPNDPLNDLSQNGSYVNTYPIRKILHSTWAADGYNYMLFRTDITFSGTITEAYYFEFEDILGSDNIPTEGYEVVGHILDDGHSPITNPSRNPEDYSLSNNKWTNYGLSHNVGWYTLVRVPSPQGNYSYYKVNNSMRMRFYEVCHPDKVKTVQSDWGPYIWNFEVTEPEGSFMIYKWGNNNWNAKTHKNQVSPLSEYPTATYRLDVFKRAIENNEEAKLDSFTFFPRYYGYPGPWTKDESYTGADQYFKKDVRWELTDNELYLVNKESDLTGTKLGAGDYCLNELDFAIEAEERKYNPDGGLWEPTSTTTHPYNPFAADPMKIYVYGQFGSDQWEKVAEITFKGSVYPYTYYQYFNRVEWSVDWVNSQHIDSAENGSYIYESGYSRKGMKLSFKGDDCTGYKIVTENKPYFFQVTARADFSLKTSEKVKNWVANRTVIYLRNYTDMELYYTDEQGNDSKAVNTSEPFFRFSDTGADAINRTAVDNAKGSQAELHANKWVVEGESVADMQAYRTNWLIRGYEQAKISGLTAYTQNTYPSQQSGTFYDVLPRGSSIDLDSIKVYNIAIERYQYEVYGSNIAAADRRVDFEQAFLISPDLYTVDVQENYKNTGLTLVTIRINEESLEGSNIIFHSGNANFSIGETYGGYSVSFDTYTTWDALDDFDGKLANAIAYQTGNSEDIINVNAYRDDPTNWNDSISSSDRALIKNCLKDLDPNTNEPLFTYAKSETTAVYEKNSSSGISKRVQGANDTVPVINTEVEPGSTYRYRLRYTSAAETTIKNIVIYDKIERWTGSQWQGTLNSVYVEAAGGKTVNPNIYISTSDTVEVHQDNVPDLANDSNWTLVTDDSQLADAVWIAVDMGDFVLEANSSVNVWLVMSAPNANETDTIKPVATNNVYISGKMTTKTETDKDIFTVGNDTSVKYTLSGTVKIQKVDEEGEPLSGVRFDLKGVSRFGNQINMTATSDDDGYVVFEEVELSGTNGYQLTETVPENYVAEKDSWTVVVNSDGSSTIDGQDSSEAYFTIVNKYNVTEISGTKTWSDENDLDGIRPSSITVNLLADGTKVDEKSVEADDEGNWNYSFTGLPKYKNGKEIVYTVTEEPVSQYEASYDDYDIINTHTPTFIDIPVCKVWDDGDDLYGIRPSSVTIRLVADDVETDKTLTLSEDNEWKDTFNDLPEYRYEENEDGTFTKLAIVYTVTEEPITLPEGYTKGYTVKIEGSPVEGFTVTNTYEPVLISLKVTKVWKDSNDADHIRPKEIEIQLYADGEPMGRPVVLGKDNNWTYTYENLISIRNGKTIKYTIDEVEVPSGYKKVISGDMETGFVITNTHTPTPKTGDNTHTSLWLGLMLISVSGIVLSIVSLKKRRK